MSAREVIAKALAEYWEVPDQVDGYELAAEDVEKDLTAAGYVILSLDEVRGIRDEASRIAELKAELDLLQDILDSRPAINAALPDSYIRWSQAIYSGDAIRSLKGGRDAQ